jgi:rubrerythrin
VLDGIGVTADNVKAAFGGETFEIDQMYPAYDAVARLQGNEQAQLTIRYARTAEVDHQRIYEATGAAVAAGKDIDDKPVNVCPICGHTVIGDAPDECPVCGTTAGHFRMF